MESWRKELYESTGVLFHSDNELTHHGVKGMKWGKRKIKATIKRAIRNSKRKVMKAKNPNFIRRTNNYDHYKIIDDKIAREAEEDFARDYRKGKFKGKTPEEINELKERYWARSARNHEEDKIALLNGKRKRRSGRFIM